MRTSHISNGLPTPYESVPQPYVKTFTEYLRALGYYCTNNYKTDYQFGNPFTAWDENGPNAHYLNRPDSNQSFFAVFNIEITHERFNWADPEKTDPERVSVPPYYPDIPEARNTIARLYDNIGLMDDQVGKLLDELERSGLAENTIVFFWSDHGDGLPRAKRWLYDSGTKIPLIVKWPGHIPEGTIVDELISSIDFGPSVLSLANIAIPVHMQGKAFLGKYKSEPREYVVSARDRFDESYDMMRSVRNKQFRYVRNYYPNQPYVLYIPYRNNNPLMKKMIEMHASGTLEGIPENWFSSTRPPEELYDCSRDPYQVKNLAEDDNYRKELLRMRKILDEWMTETGDLGSVSEELMVANNYPEGLQPVTEAPELLITSGMKYTQAKPERGTTYSSPAEITLYCATQGASIGYTFDTSENAQWKLYTGPISLTEACYLIRAKAIRYGYKESKEVVETLAIEN